jgi:hypothetical protein
MISRIAAKPSPFPTLNVSKKAAHDLEDGYLGLRL